MEEKNEPKGTFKGTDLSNWRQDLDPERLDPLEVWGIDSGPVLCEPKQEAPDVLTVYPVVQTDLLNWKQDLDPEPLDPSEIWGIDSEPK